MSLNLNSSKFRTLGVGAMLVVAGVVLKNTSEQMKNAANHPMSMVGLACFVIGWLTVAYGISVSASGTLPLNLRTLVLFGCAITLILVVMKMKKVMMAKKEMPMLLPMTFAATWLLLGALTGSTPGTRALGVLAAVCVLVSMMVALPWQRKNGIIDGPGMPLFCLAWGLLLAANR